jgi:uncharacterized protein (UPF0332 family)
MAIINTFQKCLESPYLVEDAEASGRTADLIARAVERLDLAERLHAVGQGDPADILYLSYEAMFQALRALVYAKNYREMGLHCLLIACEQLYVKRGDLDAAFLRSFELAQRMNLSTTEAVTAARAFLNRTRELLDAVPAS